MTTLQQAVYDAVQRRGYLTGDADAEAARQVAKTVEELTELAGLFIFGGGLWRAALRKAGAGAREAFDNPAAWRAAKPAADNAALAAELADVMIPLLCLAQLRGIDLKAAVRAKVASDVGRGRRDEVGQ